MNLYKVTMSNKNREGEDEGYYHVIAGTIAEAVKKAEKAEAETTGDKAIAVER